MAPSSAPGDPARKALLHQRKTALAMTGCFGVFCRRKVVSRFICSLPRHMNNALGPLLAVTVRCLAISWRELVWLGRAPRSFKKLVSDSEVVGRAAL